MMISRLSGPKPTVAPLAASKPAGWSVVQTPSAAERQKRLQSGEGVSQTSQAMGQTTRKDVLTWSFVDKNGGGYRPQRYRLSYELTSSDRSFGWLFKLPRIFAAPLVGAILLLDKMKALRWLQAPIVVPNGVSLSKYDEEAVGATLPAGLERPDLFSLLPTELFGQIIDHTLSGKFDPNHFVGDKVVKPGMNPLRNTQLSSLGERWSAVLGQNRYWQPYVRPQEAIDHPASYGLKNAFLQQILEATPEVKESVRKLYGPIFKVEQAHLIPSFDHPLTALAAVHTDGRFWQFLPEALKADEKVLELAVTSQQPGEVVVRASEGQGVKDKAALLSVLKRTEGARIWASLTAEEKHQPAVISNKLLDGGDAGRLLRFWHSDLHEDVQFVGQWLKIYPPAIFTLSPSLENNPEVIADIESSWPDMRTFVFNRHGDVSLAHWRSLVAQARAEMT